MRSWAGSKDKEDIRRYEKQGEMGAPELSQNERNTKMSWHYVVTNCVVAQFSA